MSTNKKQVTNKSGNATSKPDINSKNDSTAAEPTKKNMRKNPEEMTVTFTSRRVWPD